MNLDQLRARQTAIVARQAAIAAIPESESRTLSSAEVNEDTQLTAEFSSLEETARVLIESSARNVAPVSQRAAGHVRGAIGPGRSNAPAVLTHTRAQLNGDAFEGQSFARINLARLRSALNAQKGIQESVPQILAELFPGRPELSKLAAAQQRFRAAGVEGGATVSGEAGSELLRTDATFTGDFVSYLYSKTTFDQMGFRRIQADVVVKGQDGAFTGYFVGEKKPIPVSIGSYNDVTLRRLKAAGLTYMSRDLIERSAPAAELLFRDGVVQAIAQAVDTLAFSATAASSGVAPAGLLAGITGAASVGGRIQDLYTDLAYLTNIFIAAKNADGPLKLVSNRTIANQIAHLISPETSRPIFEGKVTMNGGNVNGLEYVTGDNVLADNLLLIKPSDVWVIDDTGVRVELSTDATIEADSAPTGEGSGPTAQSANMLSLFQTDMVAIKAVRDINWQYRRTSTIVTARKTAVKYDGTASTTD